MSKTKYTSIGGQAVIEGVMMRGPKKTSLCVRVPDGSISTDTFETYKGGKKPWYEKILFVRGVTSLISTLMLGYKCLMKSATLSGMEEEEEPTRFEKWLMKLFGEDIMKPLMTISAFLGVLLAVGLFVVLPVYAVAGLNLLVDLGGFKTLVEGLLKIAIFVLYLWAVSRMPDIRRVFEYHGAEHKTIACFEAGEELTPQNARKHTRFHPRCGTSFLLIVLIISILVFSVVSWESGIMRVVIKLALMPVVVGISYEIIKLAGRYDNVFTRIISAPGMWLQNLTTREPDDRQLEVAIAAMNEVI